MMYWLLWIVGGVVAFLLTVLLLLGLGTMCLYLWPLLHRPWSLKRYPIRVGMWVARTPEFYGNSPFQ